MKSAKPRRDLVARTIEALETIGDVPDQLEMTGEDDRLESIAQAVATLCGALAAAFGDPHIARYVVTLESSADQLIMAVKAQTAYLEGEA